MKLFRTRNRILYTMGGILLAALLVTVISAQQLSVGKVENLGPPINSPVDDFGPSFTSDGKVLVFNSKRSGEQFQNIYISINRDGKWTEPLPIREINSNFNDETPYITPDGGFIFFASDRDGSVVAGRDGRGVKVSYDLYVSKNLGQKWAAPIRLPGAVNTADHERSPALSVDLKILYYTSWPFGNVRGARIMAADYKDGSFVNPRPLPPPINNNTQEVGLIPAPDGKGVYFSSLRPGGRGGWDIWYAAFENGRFGEPVNLGPGINSDKNEAYLSIIGKTLYFCSNRTDGYGRYDIYMTSLEEERYIIFSVKDKKTGRPLSVDMNLSTRVKQEGGPTLSQDLKKRTDDRGETRVKYHPLVKDLDIFITQEGYLPYFESIVTDDYKNRPRNIELVPVEKEASFDIHAIYFDFESARIRPESLPFLNRLAEYLKKNPTMKFEIIGHTDLHGTDDFNNKLSLERAAAVRDFLKIRGIDPKRFRVRGAGKTQPKVPKIGKGFDEQNRRTEFRVLEK